MVRMTWRFLIVFVSLLFLNDMYVNAGPATWGACQTACNSGYVACLSLSGIVAGTTGPVSWWAWLTSAATTCSAIQGACMVACTPLITAPTP
jgi:hypothetical protein